MSPDPPRGPEPQPASERFEPHAGRAMASMFDDVSGRYDLVNRIMTLGQDQAWRAELARSVPEEARVVLDLCTGSGASLSGLRRPGRVVLGVDVSLRMLERAASTQERAGWAPRLVCADAFKLPASARSLDAVTVAFGMRNLRPRAQALAEIERALRPGGTLSVLEAVAPRGGPWAPFHMFYVRSVIPLAGRLSADPSAYHYLARSILEFGSGDEFEADLARAGFEIVERVSFLLGATRLWVARRLPKPGEKISAPGAALQAARMGRSPRGEMPNRASHAAAEWRWANAFQLALSMALVVALSFALWAYNNSSAALPLDPWQRRTMWFLLVVGTAGFVARSAVLILRIMGPPPRR